MKTFTNGREANRFAMEASQDRTPRYVRKPDLHVEFYEVHAGKGNWMPGDRVYECGRSMAV